MTVDSHCPAFLWTEAINTANYLVNLSPTRANQGITPDQRYYNRKPRVDHLRIFGSICYLHIPKENRSKLDSKSLQCFFVGYDTNSKVYRVFDPVSKKIHLSRDVIFDEQQVGYHLLQKTKTPSPEPIAFPDTTFTDTENPTPIISLPEPPETPETTTSPSSTTSPFIEPSPLAHPIPIPPINPVHTSTPQNNLRRNPPRERRPNSRFKDHYLFTITHTHPNTSFQLEPTDFWEAISDPNWQLLSKKK
jgi:hypothetical protein